MIPLRFFIVGAQRCGTTFLYRALDSHPDIYMAKPERPEPKFFLNDENYAEGKDAYDQLHFSCVPDSAIAWGEKSTSYLEYDWVAKRIRSYFEQAKIVICLRNPVDRAISHYKFSVENGLEPRSMDDVFLRNVSPPPWDAKKTSVAPYAYIERGKYSQYLAGYLKYVDLTNIKIMVLEELLEDQNKINDLFEFLNVHPLKNTQMYFKRTNETVLSLKASAEIVKLLKNTYEDEIVRLSEMLSRDFEVWQRQEQL